MNKQEQQIKIEQLKEVVEKGQLLLAENKHEIYHILSSLDMSNFISEKQVSKNKPPLKYISVHDMLYVMEHIFGKDFSYEPVYHDSYIESKNGDLYPQKLPYLWDRYVGACVEMSVTVQNIKKSCTLPVYDSSFEAKKIESRKYMTSYGEKTIGAIDWADIHNAQMRCLTRCIAVCFGLAGYIYRGEDLPSGTIKIESEEIKSETLKDQYVREEIESLRHAIYQQIADNKGKYESVTKPTPENTALYQNGGDNRGYVSQLKETARLVQINPMEYIKTIPQGDK